MQPSSKLPLPTNESEFFPVIIAGILFIAAGLISVFVYKKYVQKKKFTVPNKEWERLYDFNPNE